MGTNEKALYDTSMDKLAATEFADARRLMKRAAESGYPPAVWMYATFVEFGIGGRKSVLKAMHWFEKLASKNDRAACAHLGEWFVEQGNEAKAIYWLWRANGPKSSLLLISLLSKRRSVRATRKVKHLLSQLKLEELTDDERCQCNALISEYSKRNPDARWSWLNRRLFLMGGLNMPESDRKALLARIKPELLTSAERRKYDHLLAELRD